MQKTAYAVNLTPERFSIMNVINMLKKLAAQDNPISWRSCYHGCTPALFYENYSHYCFVQNGLEGPAQHNWKY